MEKQKFGPADALLWVVIVIACFLGFSIVSGKLFLPSLGASKASPKPSPEQILQTLKAGNESFYTGKSTRRNVDAARLALAGKESQEKHAYATVLSCSDSRVPVELVFDAGVMELFVVRVAGNVCDTDEIGSIEYGLGHVHTPLLVVLGHTQCGAVTAVTQAAHGHGHQLERNIPPLVDNIGPAVKRAAHQHPDIHGDALVPYAIEENVWQAVEDLFMKSPAVRGLVKAGSVKVAGAIYDVGTGRVDWLKSEKVDEILARVESSPDKETEAFAGE
jgi:carbonic anhydrase